MKKIFLSFLFLASVCFADGLVSLISLTNGTIEQRVLLGDEDSTKANVDGSNIGTNAAAFRAAIGALGSITNQYAVTNLYAGVRTIDDAAEDEMNWIPCAQVGQVGTSLANTLTSDFPQSGSAQCWVNKLAGNQRAVFKIPSKATKVRSTCFFYGWQTNAPTDGVRIGYYIDYFTSTNTVLDNLYTVTWSSTNIYAVYTNTLLSSALNSKCSFLDLYSYGTSFTGGLVTNNVNIYVLNVEAYIPRTSFRVLETYIKDSQGNW